MRGAARKAMLGIAGVFLLAAALADGATATVSATGTITGSGTSYVLRLTNTGSEAIRCWRLTLPTGVMAAAIGAPPAGWQVGAPGPPPQPVLGGQAATGIPPGGSADFPFTTDTGFPAGLASALRISGDCKTDGDAPVTGPTAEGSVPPPAKPCSCKSLIVRVNPKTLAIDQPRNPNRLKLRFDLDWTLTCTTGTGECAGEVRVTAGRSFGVIPPLTPKGGRIACSGTCGRVTRDYQRFVLVDQGLGAARRGRSFKDSQDRLRPARTELLVARSCQGRPLPIVRIVVDYDARTGRLSLKTSDLDGNGREDYTGKRMTVVR